MKRRSFLEALLFFVSSVIMFLKGGCAGTTAGTDTTGTPPTGSSNTTPTQTIETITTAHKLSIDRGSVWLMQKAAEVQSQHLRAWSALAYFLIGKKALAHEEWKKSWETRKRSDNERATLGFLYMLAGFIQLRNVPAELTKEFMIAVNTDGNYIVDNHITTLIEQKAVSLLHTIQVSGISDTAGGPSNKSVELMVTLFAILFYEQLLSETDMNNAQQWAVGMIRNDSATLIIEYACLLGILSHGNGKETYRRDINTLIDYIQHAQQEDGSWIESATKNTTNSAKLLASAAALIGLSLAAKK